MMRTLYGALTVAVVAIVFGFPVVPVLCDEVEEAADQEARQRIALERVELLQTIEGWRRFAEDIGLTPRDVVAVMQAKAQKRKLQDALRQEAAVLSTALESARSAPETAVEAAERFLKVREQTLAEMEAIDADLIACVGADRDPTKLAGLMIMGAIDNGVRLLCGIKNGTIGGVPTGSDAAAHSGIPRGIRPPIRARLPRARPVPVRP